MAILLALASAFMWGTSDFLGGNASRRLRALEVYGLSQVFALLVMAAIVTIVGDWGQLVAVALPGIAAGLVGLIGMVAFYRALAIGPMGVVSPIAALGVTVPLGVAVVGGETPSAYVLAGIAAAITGILLACGPELRSPQGSRPLVLAGVAALSFGSAFVAMAAGSETSAAATMVVMRISTVTVCALGAVAFRWRLQATRRDTPTLATVGTFDAGANLTFGVASTTGLLSVTSVLASLYPVVTALLAATILRERLRPIQYAGVAAAMIGVVLITVGG